MQVRQCTCRVVFAVSFKPTVTIFVRRFYVIACIKKSVTGFSSVRIYTTKCQTRKCVGYNSYFYNISDLGSRECMQIFTTVLNIEKLQVYTNSYLYFQVTLNLDVNSIFSRSFQNEKLCFTQNLLK